MALLAGSEGSQVHDCPKSEEKTLELLALSGEDWQVDCVKDDAGRLILAASRLPENEPPTIVVGVVFGNGRRTKQEHTLRLGETALLQDLDRVEEWTVEVFSDQLGSSDIMRVNLVLKHGEDFYIGQEIVSFFRIEPSSAELIWAGRGDRLDVRFDSCVIHERATFRITKAGLLERVVKTRRSFHNAGVADALAAHLQRKCVAPRGRRDLFSLTK